MNVFFIFLTLFLVNVKANDRVKDAFENFEKQMIYEEKKIEIPSKYKEFNYNYVQPIFKENKIEIPSKYKEFNYNYVQPIFKEKKIINPMGLVPYEIKIEKETDFYIKKRENSFTTFLLKNVNLCKLNLSEDEFIGDNNINIIDLDELISQNITIKNDYLYDMDKKLIKLVNIQEIRGREMKPDHIYVNENNKYNFFNTKGGFDLNNMDLIQIESLNPNHLGFYLFPFTKLINRARKGSFTYYIIDYFNYNKTSLIEINIESNSTETKHTFDVFNSIDNIENLYLDNPSEITIELKSKQKFKISGELQKITLNFNDHKLIFVKENNLFVKEMN